MEASLEDGNLPDANSIKLHLSHSTDSENTTIWTSTSASWKDALTLPEYLEESRFLTTVPLAKDGGMTSWILVDKNLPPDRRQILCSCETFRKRAITSDTDGNVSEGVVHGVASVFCPPECRGRGYAARVMRELAKQLHLWQAEKRKCIGSILYSDIGKSYYAKLGWHPTPTNTEIVIPPSSLHNQNKFVKPILIEDIEGLCLRDEAMLRNTMAVPTNDVRVRVAIAPNLDHMLWHISKEEFVCQRLFGKTPTAKGAIAGSPGNQVWVVWTHRYYSHPDDETPDNTLYILRLVMETKSQALSYATKQAENLRAVLQAAQAEAMEWKLGQVKLWDPSLAILDVMKGSDIEHEIAERENKGIASWLWYGENGEKDVAPFWMSNEYYAWC